MTSLSDNYKDYLGNFGMPWFVISLVMSSSETITIKDFKNGTFSLHTETGWLKQFLFPLLVNGKALLSITLFHSISNNRRHLQLGRRVHNFVFHEPRYHAHVVYSAEAQHPSLLLVRTGKGLEYHFRDDVFKGWNGQCADLFE